MSNKSLLLVGLLVIAPFGGYWLGLGLLNGTRMLGSLAAVSLALVGGSWYRRNQAYRRWQAVWDAYAARDLAQSISH
jgi:hypothetical protein